MGPLSGYTGHRIFSALSITGSLIHHRIDAACPGHSVDATVGTDVEAALSPDNSRKMSPKYREARPSLIIEKWP
jgi:hypothetical protein